VVQTSVHADEGSSEFYRSYEIRRFFACVTKDPFLNLSYINSIQFISPVLCEIHLIVAVVTSLKPPSAKWRFITRYSSLSSVQTVLFLFLYQYPHRLTNKPDYLHGADSLRSSLSCSRNPLSFMESEGSLPFSLESATGLCSS
jgi:hypothetical protein